jgi:hypothetical protein
LCISALGSPSGTNAERRTERQRGRFKEFAGQADLSKTQRYRHLSPAATEDAIRLLDGRQSGLELAENVGDILDTRTQCDERRAENPA